MTDSEGHSDGYTRPKGRAAEGAGDATTDPHASGDVSSQDGDEGRTLCHPGPAFEETASGSFRPQLLPAPWPCPSHLLTRPPQHQPALWAEWKVGSSLGPLSPFPDQVVMLLGGGRPASRETGNAPSWTRRAQICSGAGCSASPSRGGDPTWVPRAR